MEVMKKAKSRDKYTMTNDQRLAWLMAGDVSIQYQTKRDLLGIDSKPLRNRITSEGWGKKLLVIRQSNGHWGRGFYQPKWTSSHYTLLDLRNLCINPANELISETLQIILEREKAPDGGINPIGMSKKSDICVNGMFLNYASYFGAKQDGLKSVVDFILHEQVADGGFNCRSNRKMVTHSSVHSTLSVIEGISEYKKNGYRYRLVELLKAEMDARSFLLAHQLFRSHRTGEIINPDFLKLHYPGRWHYDILRALDYFRSAGAGYDKRMADALGVLIKKRSKEGLWLLAAAYPGATHFDMEQAGKPSRWNTLRALRVLKYFEFD